MGLLDEKVAVITGAGSGMGKASVKVFVREGAKVVAADISGAEEDTASEVGGGVLPVHCDVSQEADVEAMMAAAVEGFGRVDAVLNVAGIADGVRAGRPDHGVLRPADGCRPAGGDAGDEARHPRHAPDGRRLHRQLVLGRRSQRLRLHQRLPGGQARDHRCQQVGGHRVRHPGDPGQHHLPGLHPHRDHGRREPRTSSPTSPPRPPSTAPGNPTRWPKWAPSWPPTGPRSSPVR